MSTRDALLVAGRTAFAERGYAGSRLADIAGAAGLTTGAFYRHFASKSEFFAALFVAYSEDLLQALAKATSLRAMVRTWLNVAREHRGVVRALHELASVGSAESDQRRQLRDDVVALALPRLQEATGLKDARAATFMVADILTQYALMEAAGWIPDRDPAAVALEVERLVKRGLYSK